MNRRSNILFFLESWFRASGGLHEDLVHAGHNQIFLFGDKFLHVFGRAVRYTDMNIDVTDTDTDSSIALPPRYLHWA